MVEAENNVIRMLERGSSLQAVERHLEAQGLSSVIVIATEIDRLSQALERVHVVKGTYTDFNAYETPTGVLLHCSIGFYADL
jgi:hypothetical protein